MKVLALDIAKFSSALALGAMLHVGMAMAQEATAPDAPAKAETPVAAAAPAPKLPAYFAGANEDPQKPAWPDATGAASGVWATPAGDAKGDIPDQLKSNDLYDRIVHNMYSINYVWVLIAGFLVMFMQAGFMLVETGLCRAKNAAHTAAMNFMVYPLGCLAFWASASAGATGSTGRCHLGGTHLSVLGCLLLMKGLASARH
jgi:Amt family ammonium transporter